MKLQKKSLFYFASSVALLLYIAFYVCFSSVSEAAITSSLSSKETSLSVSGSSKPGELLLVISPCAPGAALNSGNNSVKGLYNNFPTHHNYSPSCSNNLFSNCKQVSLNAQSQGLRLHLAFCVLLI